VDCSGRSLYERGITSVRLFGSSYWEFVTSQVFCVLCLLKGRGIVLNESVKAIRLSLSCSEEVCECLFMLYSMSKASLSFLIGWSIYVFL
jgi:hypothetical protein